MESKKGSVKKGVGSLLSGSFGVPSGPQQRLEPEAYGDPSLQRCVWVTVIHRMASDNSPSVRGQRRSRCQWVGMRQ